MRIEALFEQLNFRGPSRLKKALKNRVFPFTNLQLEKLATGETVRQIQQAAPPLNGKVASHYLGYDWQADLIDCTTAPSQGTGTNKILALAKGDRTFLIFQDVLSIHLGGGLDQ